MNAENLLLIGGTMALMLAVASFVLTQRHNWKAISLLVALFSGFNIGAFIWSENLEGWSSYRMFLFWLVALLPPLVGIAIGTTVGTLVNWRISRVRPTHNKPATKAPEAAPKQKVKREKTLPKPRIID